MVGWHRQVQGHEFEQAPRVGDGQGGLGCCNSWGRKELDTTEQLNRTEHLKLIQHAVNKLYFNKNIVTQLH